LHWCAADSVDGARLAALLIPFLAIFNALLLCLWIAAIVSLASTGAIFGWDSCSLPTAAKSRSGCHR
jgi:hypothetical protein